MEIKEEKRAGFSWVDWLLLGLLIAALSLGGFYLYSRVKGAAKQSIVVEYELLISNIETPTDADPTVPILVGTRVCSENGTTDLGEVRSVSVRPHLSAVLYDDGSLAMEEVEGRADLLVIVRAYGEDHANEGLRVNDIRIAAGSFYTVRIGQYLAVGAELLWVETEEAE